MKLLEQELRGRENSTGFNWKRISELLNHAVQQMGREASVSVVGGVGVKKVAKIVHCGLPRLHAALVGRLRPMLSTRSD